MKILSGLRRFHQRMAGLAQNASVEEFNFQKVLLVSKATRLEVEQPQFTVSDEPELRELVMKSGPDYLVHSHERHKTFEQNVIRNLEKLNAEVKLIDRYERSQTLIDWADAVISIGGDGTYLMAANKIVDQAKPVIGLNSAPERSTGFLCLPKKYSEDVYKTLLDIKQRKFAWAYRTRIRVVLQGKNIDIKPSSLYAKLYKYEPTCERESPKENQTNSKVEEFVIPNLALNEVFIAESAPATVSYLDIKADDREFIPTKNSGVCVCTGSGSSSWNYSMNRISKATVQRLFSIKGYKDQNIDELVEEYNNSLKFNADERRMDYTIRDMIPMSVWPTMPDLASNGSVRKICIRSQCREGNLVIDGGCIYKFNAGTTAVLETFPENMLKTIILNSG